MATMIPFHLENPPDIHRLLPFQLRTSPSFRITTTKIVNPKQDLEEDIKASDEEEGEGSFTFYFSLRSNCHWRIRTQNGETYIVGEKQARALDTGIEWDPMILFESEATLCEGIDHMLEILDIDQRLRRESIDPIASYTCQYVNNVRNATRKVLAMCVEIYQDLIFMYDEMEVLRQALVESVEENQARGGFGAEPASEAAIRSLETVRLNNNGDSSSETCCPICFDEFESGSEINRMPCSHLFHCGCIKKWLESSNSCPICRFKIQAQTV